MKSLEAKRWNKVNDQTKSKTEIELGKTWSKLYQRDKSEITYSA